jgi:8-oxo-dGTP diphosphatase
LQKKLIPALILNMQTLKVAAAIIINTDGEILCTKRGQSSYNYCSHKYEFPGGKIEEGENGEQALKREIMEELELEILNLKHFTTAEHKYPDFKIQLHCFTCSPKDTKISLKEHSEYRWLKPGELDTLDWAAADLPVVEKLMHLNITEF